MLNCKVRSSLLLFFILLIAAQLKAQCTYFKEVVTGHHSEHAFGIKSDGTLWGWGWNVLGQLGDGTIMNRNAPVQIGMLNNWVAISTGRYHTLGLTADGKLWAWGNNDFGQLGNGTIISQNVPVQVGSNTNWTAISAGSFHSLALTADGKAWAWGNSSHGQLGIGIYADKNTPTQIGTGTNWKSISAGGYHSMGQTADGKIWAWGRNAQGELGDGTTTDRTSPVQIGAALQWRSITAGYYHSLGITTDGKAWSWGGNLWGVLGDGTTTSRFVPTRIGTASNWVKLTAGGFTNLGITDDGKLWAWGWNGYGQLGDGTIIEQHVPVQIGAGKFWVSGAAGANSSFGFANDGSVWAWGRADYGQLGLGNNTERRTPVQFTAGNSNAPYGYTTAITAAGCSGTADGAITITATGASGPFTYSMDGLNFQTGNILPVSSGNKTVYVKNASGCIIARTVLVPFNNTLTADAGAAISICNTASDTIKATTNAAGFVWSPTTGLNNAGILNPVASPGTTTLYTLTATTGICSKTSSVLVTVLPPVQLYAGKDTSIAINKPLQLNAAVVNNSGFTNYSWSPVTGLSNPNIQNPVAILNIPQITYTVTATTANGCKAVSSITVKTIKPADTALLLVPSAFTPTGDSRNDKLNIIALGIQEFHYFKIYNRYGELVFNTTTATLGWDGTFKGKKQNAGTFIWEAEAVDQKGNLIKIKGLSLLIR